MDCSGVAPQSSRTLKLVASAIGSISRTFFFKATSPQPPIIRSVRDRFGTCRPVNWDNSVSDLGRCS